MSYTSKIRVLLVAVAVIPPLLILIISIMTSQKQLHRMQTQAMFESLYKASDVLERFMYDLELKTYRLKKDIEFQNWVTSSRNLMDSGSRLVQSYGFDYAELVDKDGRVMKTANRPGLLNIKRELYQRLQPKLQLHKTIEYDRQGQHAAYTFTIPLSDNLFLYTGQFVDSTLLFTLDNITDGTTAIHFKDSTRSIFERMAIGQLHKMDGIYRTILTNPDVPTYIITLQFNKKPDLSITSSLIKTTAIVALLSIFIAILLGIYITGRTKKEIENLVTATTKVAEGDLTTTVMAYEEGEFSTLADSFTEMVIKLKATQSKLSTVEKIAAWQTVGRKIAHEIKNPLSPISIAADDLRRSYLEKLPDFDKTLTETTTTIKSEVKRMTELLDEFVSFARMKQSEPVKTNLSSFVDNIKQLYPSELDNNNFSVRENYSIKFLSLDPNTFKQVLINLIKNGFEAFDNAVVTLTVIQDQINIYFIVEDNGPGFTEEKLANSFEPFATTKKDGSGLGLVICHRIIHDHNGSMELYNRKDGGGGVKITLPV